MTTDRRVYSFFKIAWSRTIQQERCSLFVDHRDDVTRLLTRGQWPRVLQTRHFCSWYVFWYIIAAWLISNRIIMSSILLCVKGVHGVHSGRQRHCLSSCSDRWLLFNYVSNWMSHSHYCWLFITQCHCHSYTGKGKQSLLYTLDY